MTETRPEFRAGERERKFFEQHKVEENKFESFEAAETFFRNAGFEIKKEAQADHAKLTALKHLLENASPVMIQKMRDAGKMQATWMLEAV